MNEFEEKVKKFINRHELIQKGSSILVGVFWWARFISITLFFEKAYKSKL